MLLDSAEVCKINCLSRFKSVFGGLGNILAVGLCHFGELGKEVDLPEKLLEQLDIFLRHGHLGMLCLIELLFFDKSVGSVKRNAPVVADYAASAVCIGKTGNETGMANGAHFVGICPKNAVVVGGTVSELSFDLVGELFAVCGAGLPCHSDAAEGVDGTL